jgi:hypothetical protein
MMIRPPQGSPVESNLATKARTANAKRVLPITTSEKGDEQLIRQT